MGQKKSKNKVVKRKKRNINIIHIISFAFCIYFIYTMIDQQTKINNYDSQIEMYEADIEVKNGLLDYYSQQSENIQTDEYIESVARDKLGYVKPYEKIFVDANR
ncbi:MAG: septum formation initiator family protein [Clostridia bacterium]|nr:septum formation initiator family protein [Clostridia bacterium]